MEPCLEIWTDGNPCSALAGVVLLIVLGAKVANEQARVVGGGLASAVVFVACIVQLVNNPPDSADEFFVVALRAAWIGGFVLGMTWLASPLLQVTFHVGPVRAWNVWNEFTQAWRQRRESARRAREHERSRQERAAEEKRLEPERERLRVEQEAEETKAKEAKRRREDVRSRLELFFNIHQPDLAQRFTREDLKQFMDRYLGDDRDADYVETRGEQLYNAIRQFIDKTNPRKSPAPLDQTLQEMDRKREAIANLQIPDEMKEILLGKLETDMWNKLNESLEDL